MVWYGLVWYGMVWYGMVWYGMVRYGKVRQSLLKHGITSFLKWSSSELCTIIKCNYINYIQTKLNKFFSYFSHNLAKNLTIKVL